MTGRSEATAGTAKSAGRDTEEAADGQGRERSPLPVDVLLAGYLAVTGALALGSLTVVGAALAAAHAAGIWVLLGPVAGLDPEAPVRDALAGGSVSPEAVRTAPPPIHVARFVRVAYPVLLTPLLYTELELLNQFYVQGYLDAMVQGWEEALFGAQLSVVWAERQPWRWLSELMHLGYFSYYLLIPISALVVYRRGGQGELHRFTMVTGLAFFLCYVAFVVFPVTGPRYLYDQLQGAPAGALLFDAVHAVAEGGSSKGTAFPSSHVAATVAAWLACRRVARRWYWMAAPFVLLLTLGTVYGRFHYAVDALAGVFVALAAWKLAPALTRRVSPGDRGRSRG